MESESLKAKPVKGRIVTIVPTKSWDEIVPYKKKLWAVYSHDFLSFVDILSADLG